MAGKDPLRKKQLLLPKQDPAAVYAAVDSYFQAFLKAVNQGGGVPDQKLVATAQKAMPNKTGLDNVEYAVWVSLDATMGWDFMYPSKLQRASGYVGNIREVHGVNAASGIVDAARKGLLDAVQSGDATKVTAPRRSSGRRIPTLYLATWEGATPMATLKSPTPNQPSLARLIRFSGWRTA
jgi:hypothetical protein